MGDTVVVMGLMAVDVLSFTDFVMAIDRETTTDERTKWPFTLYHFLTWRCDSA